MMNKILQNTSYLNIFLLCFLVTSCVERNGQGSNVIESYADGRKKLEISIDPVTKDKCVKSYYPNGILKEKYYIVNNEIEGIYEEYFENGQLALESFYKSGSIKGKVKSYYRDGKLKQSSIVENGKREGMVKEYNENGHIKVENFVVADFIHFVKLYNYDSLSNLKSTSEIFIPTVSLDKDVLNYKDTLEITFSLPLPRESFNIEGLAVKYDFKKLASGESNIKNFDYPSNVAFLENGKVKKGFIAEEKGDYLVYGFISTQEDGKEKRHRHFEKEFLVQ